MCSSPRISFFLHPPVSPFSYPFSHPALYQASPSVPLSLASGNLCVCVKDLHRPSFLSVLLLYMHPKPCSATLVVCMPLPWAQQEEAGRKNGVETRDRFLDASVGRWGSVDDLLRVSPGFRCLPFSVCLRIVCSCSLLIGPALAFGQ